MKKIIHGLFAVGLLLLTALSCREYRTCGCGIPPQTLFEAWVTDGPWQLISATRYNDMGTISGYKGNMVDTLDFGHTVPAGVAININGVYSSCLVGWPVKDSTIKLFSACRPNYNDTLWLQSLSDNSLVFKVKFDSANIHGWELDSLKKMYFWHP